MPLESFADVPPARPPPKKPRLEDAVDGGVGEAAVVCASFSNGTFTPRAASNSALSPILGCTPTSKPTSGAQRENGDRTG